MSQLKPNYKKTNKKPYTETAVSRSHKQKVPSSVTSAGSVVMGEASQKETLEAEPLELRAERAVRARIHVFLCPSDVGQDTRLWAS